MNFTQFYEIFLQQGCLHYNWSNSPKYASTEKQDWTELSLRNNGYNARFSRKSRLEHGFAIEFTHFQ